jgi:DNA-binding CsgD family transcriptional regulator
MDIKEQRLPGPEHSFNAPDIGDLQTLFDNATQALGVFQNHDLVFANRAMLDMIFADSMEQAGGLDAYRIFEPQITARLMANQDARIRLENVVSTYEVDTLRPSGDKGRISITGKLVGWAGNPAILTASLDVTAQHRALQELKAQEEYYRQLLPDVRASDPRFAPGLPKQHLSRREKEALRWVAIGKTDEEIGLILKLSPKTIHAYVESAKKKLNASTRTYAVVQALRFGEIRL